MNESTIGSSHTNHAHARAYFRVNYRVTCDLWRGDWRGKSAPFAFAEYDTNATLNFLQIIIIICEKLLEPNCGELLECNFVQLLEVDCHQLLQTINLQLQNFAFK